MHAPAGVSARYDRVAPVVGQDGPMASQQRVYLHVGLPKTGTSFVQDVLFSSREDLRDAGVLYPARYPDEHFFAALDLQDLAFNDEPRPEAAGRWAALAEQVRAWPGTSIVSHDVLAAASREQVQRALESLAPAEVHVVVTVRELGSHLVSAWQEGVKHGETAAFEDWFSAVCAHDESRWHLAWYQQSADLPAVLRRWTSGMPAGRVHVVTVPRPGTDRAVLWERFASVVRVDAQAVDLSRATWLNPGLGADGTTLLRRVNAARAGRLSQREYEHLVKGVLAHETLTRFPHPVRSALPAAALTVVEQRTEQWIEAVRASGAHVVGDLGELRVVATSPSGPDGVAADDVLDVATFAIWELLLRVRDTGGRVAELERQLAGLRAERDAVPARNGPARRLVRRASEHSPAVMRARVAWWHTVERLRDR
jgi:hypothetical protein